MRHLRNKTALVTGAAGGIGKAIAAELAVRGMRLLVTDIEPAGLAEAARLVTGAGGSVESLVADLSLRADQLRLTRWVTDLGGVDLLVNNAGIAYHGCTDAMPLETWDRILAVNLGGAVRITLELLPSLLRRPEAHILNVCSVLGLVGLPKVCAYSTTKYALVGFSESLRAEYGRQGIGVTALCPGFVETDLVLPPGARGHWRRPPQWMCLTPQRVAQAAVRAVERNRRQVVLEPAARMLAWLARFAPWLIDWGLHLGRQRCTARRIAHWRRHPNGSASLSPEAVERRAA